MSLKACSLEPLSTFSGAIYQAYEARSWRD